MTRNLFRLFGVLTLLYVASLPFFIFIEWNRNPNHLHSVSLMRLSVSLLSLIVVGVGLLYLRKWAAIYFSFLLLAVSIWLILGSTISGFLFPWSLFNIALGLMLIFPTIVTIKLWSELRWRGKWFF